MQSGSEFRGVRKMKSRFMLVLLVLVCGGATQVSIAQDPRGSAPAGTSAASSASLDNLGVSEYRLGPGDELELKFFQQPDLNTTATVGADGTISLPFLKQPIPVSCKTDREVATEVTTAYSRFFKSPQISVRVTGRLSRPSVAVYGAVREPTRIQALRKVKLNEVISFAGGTTERSNGTIQIIHTTPALCQEPAEAVVPVETAENSIAPPINLYKISDIIQGKPDSNPYVRPGDVVLVLEAQPVYVTGSVVNPQGLYLTEGMTLQRALAMVGGPRKEAKSTAIKIYRLDPVTGKTTPIPVDYSAIKKQQKPDIALKAYDIIDVPEAGLLAPSRIGTTLTTGLMSGLSSVVAGPMSYLPTRVLY
jgi:polysaccharide export outer membrane protein